MGVYVSPAECSKEEWLGKHAECVQPSAEIVAMGLEATPKQFLVCLVDNGMFSAAAVCYSLAEYEAFNDPGDRRPRVWFLASEDDLRAVSDLGDYVPALR